MTHFSYLFTDKSKPENWDDTKSELEENINAAILKGNTDIGVLNDMKELLKDIHINTSMLDYIDKVKD